MGLFDFTKGREGSGAKTDGVEFDANGRVAKVDLHSGRWQKTRSGENVYFTQSGRSLLQAAEVLKALPSVPGRTYYIVETPDGTLARDTMGFYTEGPIRTSGIALETHTPEGGQVDSAGLTGFGELLGCQFMVAQLKAAGQYGALVLLQECGHCGYQSPVETRAGDFERQCYACGAINKNRRANVDVFVGTRMVEI